jgi:hypothetical protein
MLGRVMVGERCLDRSRMFAACVGTQATPVTVVGVERVDQAGKVAAPTFVLRITWSLRFLAVTLQPDRKALQERRLKSQALS